MWLEHIYLIDKIHLDENVLHLLTSFVHIEIWKLATVTRDRDWYYQIKKNENNTFSWQFTWKISKNRSFLLCSYFILDLTMEGCVFISKRNWTFYNQMVALTEKLTDLKFELPIACLERDIQFLSYTFSSIKMKISKLFVIFLI
jgi:hypothetical protein